jgi:uncharacterized membrane protein YbaN (DUF454 family)
VALFWRFLGILALLLAAAASGLPVLPAVPFLLLAAAAATSGWPWLADRLSTHATLGPAITRWQERSALSHKVKLWSILALGASALMAWIVPAPIWAAAALTVVLGGYAAWLWRRPES